MFGVLQKQEAGRRIAKRACDIDHVTLVGTTAQQRSPLRDGAMYLHADSQGAALRVTGRSITANQRTGMGTGDGGEPSTETLQPMRIGKRKTQSQRETEGLCTHSGEITEIDQQGPLTEQIRITAGQEVYPLLQQIHRYYNLLRGSDPQ